MNSLINSYKNLFFCSHDYTENFRDSKIYKINLLKFNRNLGNQITTDRLSIGFYYLFIHILLFFVRLKGLEEIKVKDDSINPNSLVNNDLLQFIKEAFSKEQSIQKCLFKFDKQIIGLNFNELRNIEKIVKESTKENFFFGRLHSQLVTIQHLVIEECNEEKISFAENFLDKKTFGKYYSPKILTDFMIRILSNSDEISRSFSKILDPSCGSGLFLISILDVSDNKKKFQDYRSVNLLKGIDIDYKSLLTSNFLILLLNIEKNIYLSHDDFLLYKSDSGERFDLIVGNPPYIRERNFNKQYRKELEEYKTFKGKSDLYFTFIEQANNFLNPGGYVAFILPRYWIESEFGERIREFITNNFLISLIIDFRNYKLFEIGVHSVVLIVEKKKASINITNEHRFTVINVQEDYSNELNMDDLLNEIFKNVNQSESTGSKYIQKIEIKQNDLGKYWILQPKKIIELIEKIKDENSLRLSTIATINEGINTGADKVSKHHLKLFSNLNVEEGEGIFVLSDCQLKDLHLLESERKLFIKKWIKGKDISKWTITSHNQWLIYFTDELNPTSRVYSHLEKYKDILENRAEIKRNLRRKWFELAWPRKKGLFETQEKLLIRYKARELITALDQEGFYTSADFRIVQVKKPYHSYVILGILNSNVINWLLKNQAKKLGKINDYYSYLLKEIPVIYPDKEIEYKIISLVSKIIKLCNKKNINMQNKKNLDNKLQLLEERLNNEINKLYKLTKDEIVLINEN